MRSVLNTLRGVRELYLAFRLERSMDWLDLQGHLLKARIRNHLPLRWN
jgi:hypothetical protein